ncbi:MAG: amino acid ABC transporter substrate-binding protein [Treponema sp.]|nr:amino acid ABC transporter substrate-binding protein [Treponema sp.]
MKKLFTAAAAALLAAAFVSCSKKAAPDNSLEALKERGVFVLGLDASFPPMGFTDDDGNIVGYDIDLAKEVASRLGVEFKAQPIDWDAKEMELSSGNIDCIWNGFTITDERKEKLEMTKPYLNNDQVLVVKNNSGISSLKDAAGKLIGVQRGSSAQEAIEDNEEFATSIKETVLYPENLIALNDLEIGGVDGVVMDSVVASYDITTSNKPLVLVSEVLANEAYGVGFRKGEVKLCNEVQRILEEMAADGTVAAISTKWFGSDISVIGK